MKLIEIFNKPSEASWEWEEEYDTDDSMVNYLVRLTNGSQYAVSIERLNKGIWEITFLTKRGRYGITNTGNAPQVFNAVASCIRDFIQKFKPKAFVFSAKEQSRKKLYNVLARKMARELGWMLDSYEVEDNKTQYVISSFDWDRSTMNQTLPYPTFILHL